MSAAPTAVLRVGGRELAMEPNESVLEALERCGIDVPSGCRSGTCKKCLLQAEGQPPPAAQRGLRPQWVDQRYFLACQARPTEGTLALRSAAGPRPVWAQVEGRDLVAPDVLRLFLRPERPLGHRPGQYLDVLPPSGAPRSYSIASLADEGLLELHVRRVPEGLVSGWIHGLAVGAKLRIRGPFGQCYHVADQPLQKLLLVGSGTGLAPLLGIARDALSQGHRGAIDLVHGALEPDRLYLRDELAELAQRWPRLRVHHCVLRKATAREHEGWLDEVAIRLAGPLDSARAFLCGDEAMVQRLQRALFLAGMPSGEIFADPFTPAARTPAQAGG